MILLNCVDSQCDDTDCPVVECPDIPGMTLNPGFTLPGECCPVGVECYCDCPPPKACPPGSVSVVTVAANETQELCCDVTDCEPGIMIALKNIGYLIAVRL